jgi:hypothetical protein
LRTGWNPNETVLTPNRVMNGVGGLTFKMTASVVLDDQVDAQPLIVTGQAVPGQGTHDIVYVATENNTLYAIDANTDAILLQRNFGPPVPQSALPGGCNNNAANVGVGGTPVIDRAANTLYLIAYTYVNSVQEYFIHAVSLSTLDDLVPPVRVDAKGKLRGGTNYPFNAVVSRQRAALLLANGNVYAGFASFCDVAANQSRGWVLGWHKDTLVPLPIDDLTNKLNNSPDSFFLTSIWMSGYGLASLPSSGDIYFVTGNSDYSGDTINSVYNVAESAVQLSSNLKTMKSVFTPDNAVSLENSDADFGSGGLMLLPVQPGAASNLAVAAGKDGNMYFLNADNLNNNTTGNNRILGTYGIGGCWCGQSYFTASDGSGRVVASGGNSVGIWKVKAGPPSTLKFLRSTASVGGNQDPGFFTVVSSNGTMKRTPIVWAVSRPDGTPSHNVSLFAFDATSGATLMSGVAGSWPNTGGNSNIAPVAANGKVYVASFQTLAIFGLSSAPAAIAVKPAPPVAAKVSLPPGMHEISGTVRAMNDYVMTVAKRDGSLVTVDGSAAARNLNYAQPKIGNGVLVRGTINQAGVFDASIVLHAKKDPAMWLPDR